MSEKIRAQHLARKAILYVRQSSVYQVAHNLESQKLQYAMERRLRDLGWNAIEIIDEDLGRSASGAVARTGFERMVSEVCLGHVGAVAAREVSRFARNSREWQQLIEVCRIVDTVLIDQETVYVPRQSNDRLLLGLKGSLNEYELDLLRQRSLEARLEKARRGELSVMAPIGYLRSRPAGTGNHCPGVSQMHGTGQCSANPALVCRGGGQAAGARWGWPAALEACDICEHSPHVDQSSVWWCLCLWAQWSLDRIRAGEKPTLCAA